MTQLAFDFAKKDLCECCKNRAADSGEWLCAGYYLNLYAYLCSECKKYFNARKGQKKAFTSGPKKFFDFDVEFMKRIGRKVGDCEINPKEYSEGTGFKRFLELNKGSRHFERWQKTRCAVK